MIRDYHADARQFLSTPSGWRATELYAVALEHKKFLSTPSGWRATLEYRLKYILCCLISIHALRVEGDRFRCEAVRSRIQNFYPRPPGGGRQPVSILPGHK